MSGTYKPVSYSGTKEVCAAMGAPPELVQKLLNDSKAKVCITMDGPFYCFSFKSSIMPMEMGFKVGEEFDFASPFDPTDVQKCLYAVNGNCLMVSAKGKLDTTSKMTFTDHFLIQETHLCGTPICEKDFYTRVDCGGCSNCC
jgi:hypothetical protein